jgi:hypothetical protein
MTPSGVILITDQELIQQLNAGYTAAKEFYRNNIWPERNTNFELYTGKNPKKKYKSEANFHVPYAATLIDSVWPLLTARMPFATVEGRNPERDYEAADLTNELIDYTYDVNNFELTFLLWQKTSMYYDTSWLKETWDYTDEKTDHPKIQQIDSNQILVHPQKIELDDRWPLYHVQPMTKSQMKDMGWDEVAIDSLGDSKYETSDQRKAQLKAMGITSIPKDNTNKADDLYEVVEIWGKMDLGTGKEEIFYVCLCNEEKILNTQPMPKKAKYASPYSHGFYPFVPLWFNKNAGIFHGEAPMSRISSQQKELNALENMKADNYKRRNNPPLTVKRTANIDQTTLKWVNSAPWIVNEHTDIQPVILPDLAPSIDNQQAMIKSVMQNAIGANDVMLVSDTNGIKGGDTAAGASIANENTKTRFRPQATFIDAALKRVGEITIGLYQDKNLFDRPKAIAIADKEGNFSITEIKPSQIQNADLTYKVKSASTLAESNNQKLGKLMNIKQLYAQNPEIKQEELDREIFATAELDYESLFRTKDEQMMDLSMKLRELVAVANRPDFKEQDPAYQQQVLAQIDKMTSMLQGGGQTGQMAAPAGPGQPGATEGQTEQM